MTNRIRRFPRIPTEEEVGKLLETVQSSTYYKPNMKGKFLRARDYTMMKLYFSTGLRPGECVNLLWSDIDWEHNRIRITPDRNKVRVNLPACLTQPAAACLKEFKNICNSIGINLPYIFPSIETFGPITVDRGERIVLKMAKEAGIAQVEWYTSNGQPKYNIRQYTGRHAFATRVYRKTRSESAVQIMMRHMQRKSSECYIHLVDEDKDIIAAQVFNAF